VEGIAVLFSRKSDLWRTPQEVFDRYDRIYNFDIDGAADSTNHLCDVWYGPDGIYEDYLTASPWGMQVWLNPPYSAVKDFVEKAAFDAEKGTTTVALLPARTDTRWFHKHIYMKPNVRVELLKGRIKFLDENGQQQSSAPFPSMVVTFFPVEG
jgi:phage N-6-adenine-methyltransferase